MLTPPGTLCTLKLIYVRLTPRQRSSFQISDWLVWQLRDCVWVFFHVEVDTLESSARSKSCWLEQTSYRRRFWSDSSNYSGQHHVLRCVYRACSLLRGKKDRVFYYNWAHVFKYKITLRHRHIVTHLMSLVAVNIKYNVQTKNITEIGLFWLNHLCNFEFQFHSSKYTWPRSIHEE